VKNQVTQMFEARFLQGGILKKIIDCIKDLVNDANIDCSPNGISLQAMDSSHVALVSLNILAEHLSCFSVDHAKSFGINLSSMAKVLKCATNDDAITIKSNDNEDEMIFVFEHPKNTRISYFALKLMDIDSEHLGIPDTEYDCVITMSSNEFQRICREINIIGDTVKISTSKEGVKFSVVGDIGVGSIVCKSNHGVVDSEDDSVSITVNEDVSLTFALRYLNMFAKATHLSSTVTLKMSSNVPLVCEYNIGDGGQMGFLRYYLAPKIDDEEMFE
jgi:proliferating cell nuclear antigen